MFHVSIALISRLLISLLLLAGLSAPGARVGPGPAAERARRVRFLRAVAVVVALVLRGGGGARQQRPFADPVRRTAVRLRGPRAVAAIRARLSRILPAAVAAARTATS